MSTLDGKNMKPIITDSFREMNHARVSPDKKWVTFTRFNNRKKGLAEEKGGYLNTEIMICRLDGTGLRSLTPHRRLKAFVNSYWTPDGKGVIFINNDLLKKRFQISYIDIATGHIRRVPTPPDHVASDPHQWGNKIVFPVIGREDNPNGIWIMNADGKDARQLTRPIVPKSAMNLKPRPGDSDPKISPDGTKVACTRHIGKANLHTIVVDIETGEEKDLSKGLTCDVMPEWSSDGKLLVFWHADPKVPRNSGLYAIRPDGTDRKRISLPRGYFYKMPAFFPGEGSGKDARIIFTAKKMPGL